MDKKYHLPRRMNLLENNQKNRQKKMMRMMKKRRKKKKIAFMMIVIVNVLVEKALFTLLDIKMKFQLSKLNSLNRPHNMDLDFGSNGCNITQIPSTLEWRMKNS